MNVGNCNGLGGRRRIRCNYLSEKTNRSGVFPSVICDEIVCDSKQPRQLLTRRDCVSLLPGDRKDVIHNLLDVLAVNTPGNKTRNGRDKFAELQAKGLWIHLYLFLLIGLCRGTRESFSRHRLSSCRLCHSPRESLLHQTTCGGRLCPLRGFDTCPAAWFTGQWLQHEQRDGGKVKQSKGGCFSSGSFPSLGTD